MVRAIAVDYGGVLVKVPSEPRNIEQIAAAVGLTGERLKQGVYGRGRALWNQTKVGWMPESEYWRQVQKALELPMDKIEWIKCRLFDDVTLHVEFVRYIEGLRGRYSLALVSNAIPSFTDTWRRLGFLDLFPVVINSSRVGVAKPSSEIFHLAAQRLGVEPADCVFVDDQVGHIKAAMGAGFRGVHYAGAAEAIAQIDALRGC